MVLMSCRNVVVVRENEIVCHDRRMLRLAILGVNIISAFVMLLTVAVATTANAEPISPESIHVIDGDTIGLANGLPNARLVGFNAPETFRATCDAEGTLGARATTRLKSIVGAGNLDLTCVRCDLPSWDRGDTSL